MLLHSASFIFSEHAQNQSDIAENLDRISKSTSYQNANISEYFNLQIRSTCNTFIASKQEEYPDNYFLSHLLVAGCNIGVRFSVRPSVSPSVRLSTFMSTFDIYVKVSILINYKTKQPSNLA